MTQKKKAKSDPVVEKLDQMFDRLYEIKSGVDILELKGRRMEQRMRKLQIKAAVHDKKFDRIIDKLIQYSTKMDTFMTNSEFNEFKWDISGKLDGLARLSEKVDNEATLVGHTLDRHEDMLKVINKKVGLAHLN